MEQADSVGRIKAFLEKISETESDSSNRKEAKELLEKLDDDVMLRRIKELENDIADKEKDLITARFMLRVLEAESEKNEKKTTGCAVL